MCDANWSLVPVMAPGTLITPNHRLATSLSACLASPIEGVPLHASRRAGVRKVPRRRRLLGPPNSAGRRRPARALTRRLPSSCTRTLLIPIQDNPRSSSIVAVLLHQFILLSQGLDCDDRADGWMPIVARYRCGDDEWWTVFLVALSVAAASVQETCCQRDKVDAEDDDDGDADGVRPVETFVLLI